MKKRLLSLLLAAAMVLSMLPGVAFAADSAADSFTNPFTSGTLNSTSWRIPAMVTLDDGTIVAAADARWNTTYDGGGLDTAVAYSTDNGATWTKSLENYLDDNGSSTTDVYNYNYTCFIDPALATDGSIVWMLCDLYPYGIAINGNGSQTTPYSGSTGFNDDGYLLLAKSSSRATSTSDYKYYLNGSTIYSSDGTAVEGLTVDADFNVTGTYNGSTVNSNLFFSDSPFKVYPTGYLYLKSSRDGGETWSAPTLLNLKTSSEMVCLVGPGRGLVTSNGNVIFPVYSYNGSTGSQQLSFLSMDGATGAWSRSTSLSFSNLDYTWSSESAVVELTDDGTLRFFFRNDNSAICYADYNNGWKNPVNTGVPSNSDTQMSAISYSKTIGGKQVILLSCPTGPNGNGSDDNDGSYRTSGKLHIFTVDASTGAMTLQNKINITNVATGKLSGSNYTASQGFFAYSCLTEMEDGSVALLYENNQYGWGAGDGKYYTITSASYSEDELGVTFDSTTSGGTELTDEETGVTVTTESAVLTDVAVTAGTAQTTENDDGSKTVSKTWSIELNDGDYTGAATVKLPYDPDFDGCTSFYLVVDGEQVKDEDAVTKDGNYFVCKVPHFSDVEVYGVMPVDEGGDTQLEDTVTSSGGTTTSYDLDIDGLDNSAQYLIVYNNQYALTNTKENLAVTVSDDKASFTGDASSVLWTYSNGYITNGSNYLYLNRSGSMFERTYSLNIDSTEQSMSVTNNNDGTYQLYRSWTGMGTTTRYVNYGATQWTVGSSAHNLYFYKYTQGTASYTVEAALQESRISSLTVSNDGYTDESWAAYQSALAAAQAKLTSVESGSYSSETAANTALSELIAAVNALETAKKALEKAVVITVNYVADGKTVATGTFNVTSSATSVALPSTVSDGTNTYTVDNTTLTLKEGVTEYNVAVTKLDGIPVTVTEGSTLNIDLSNSTDNDGYGITLTTGQYVKWTTSDSSYVGVAGVYDSTAGAYTDAAIIAGQNVTTSPVLVTGTVYNENGAVAGVYKWLVTVTEDTASGDMITVSIKFDIAYLRNCTVYYSINAGPLTEIKLSDLYSATDSDGNTYYYLDAVLNDSYTNSGHGVNVSFFAKPDDGYALTYMKYTSDQAMTYDYYTVSNGNPDGSGSEAWPFDDEHQSTVPTSQTDTAWKNNSAGNCTGYGWALLQGNMTLDQWKLMMSNAIALGCDGVQLFTKNDANATFEADLNFVAQKLPEMNKEIVSVTRGVVGASKTNVESGTEVTYYDGIAVYIGDTINYEVTVYVPTANSTYGTIDYSAITLKDDTLGITALDGAASWAVGSITPTETAVDGFTYTNSAKEKVTYSGSTTAYTYTATLKLGTDNFTTYVKGGKISNTASLAYTYKSNYSTGSISASSSAVAAVSVEPAFVVDFGLPIEMDLSDMVTSYGTIIKFNNVSVSGATTNSPVTFNGAYGSFSWNGLILTYTPTRVMLDTEDLLVTLANNAGAYYIAIHPASNVLYEEGFMTAQIGSANYADWSDGSKTNDNADAKQNPENVACYGYDKAYDSETEKSGSTYSVTLEGPGKMTENLVVDFYGNCFDLIGTCGSKTGYVYLAIRSNDGGSNKVVVIDTSNSKDTFYQVPLAHVDLTLGNYTAYVFGGYRQVDSNGMSFFGAGSMGASDDLFAMFDRAYEEGLDFSDVEFVYFDESSALASYANSMMMYAVDGDTTESDNATQTIAKQAGGLIEIDGFRVYGKSDNGAFDIGEYDVEYKNVLKATYDKFVGYIEGGTYDTENPPESGATYEAAGGPQNEIYLIAGDSVTFNVNADVNYAQISARAVSDEAAMQSGTNYKYTIKSNTEMYYNVELVSTTDDGGNVTGKTIVIKNTGSSSLLALGNLKLTTENRAYGVSATELMLLSVPTEATYATAFTMLRAYSGEEEDTETPVEPETPEEPEEPAQPEVPTIIWPTYTPEQNNVFRPDEFEMDVDSYTLFGKRFVSIVVNASTDVEKLTINGTPVWANNYLLVRTGLDDQYRFTMLLLLDVGEMAHFEVVAYDKNGKASKTYTITD